MRTMVHKRSERLHPGQLNTGQLSVLSSTQTLKQRLQDPPTEYSWATNSDKLRKHTSWKNLQRPTARSLGDFRGHMFYNSIYTTFSGLPWLPRVMRQWWGEGQVGMELSRISTASMEYPDDTAL